MAEIKDIIVWRRTNETRVYIHTVDGREACKYATGNSWHAKGAWKSTLTDDELKRAKLLGVINGHWTTVYEWEMLARIAVVDDAPGKSESPILLAAQIRKNRKPGHCQTCGKFLQAGEGELVHLADEEDIDFIGGGSEWVIYCLDTTACQARVDAVKQEVAQKAAEKAAGLDDAATLAQRVAEETGLEEQMDWSWDDFRFTLGQALGQGERHVAREYLESGNVIGFVVKEKQNV